MKKSKKTITDPGTLRQKAEELLKKKPVKKGLPLSEVETLKLIHELEVHQIELEMNLEAHRIELEKQKEELTLANEQTEAIAEKYSVIYDFAPTGYFTLSNEGEITEINLNGAQMLGKDRKHLKNCLFGVFVSDDSKPVFNAFLEKVFSSKVKEFCELTLSVFETLPVYCHLTGIVTENEEQCLLIVEDITKQKQLNDLQAFLLHCGYPGSNENFFESLARYLAKSLNMEYVCIDRLEGDGLTAHTVAIFNDGKFDTNVTCTLRETPCGDLAGKTICCFPENVRGLFPRDSALQDLKAESYIGTTLWGFDGKPIGLIAVIGRNPLQNPMLAEAMLKLVAIRAAGELERTNKEEELKIIEERFTKAFLNNPAALSVSRLVDGLFVDVNETFIQLFGYERKEMIGTKATEIKMYNNADDRAKITRLLKKDGKFKNIEINAQNKKGEKIIALVSAEKISFKGEDHILFSTLDITQRKLTEEALKKSEQLYRAIGESIDFGVWVCEPDGRNIYASPSYLNLVGITQEQCANFGWGDTLHPDDTEKTIAAWKECVKAGGNWDIEHRFKGVDGQWHPILARGVPIRDEHGNITSWAGINLDISNLKNVEKELRESEERFRTIAETVPVLICITRVEDSIVLFTNEANNKAFGLRGKDIIGTRGPDYYWDPSDRIKMIELVKIKGFIDNYELKVRKSDGTPFWIMTSIKPIIYNDQPSMIGASIDITNRKTAEEELRVTNNKLQTVLNSISDGLLILDKNWRYTYFNEQGAVMIGMHQEDVIGQNVWELFPYTKGSKFYEGYHQAVESNQTVVFEEFYPDPINKWFECHCYPSSEGLSVYFQDITVRKIAQEALEQSEKRLKFAQNASGAGVWDWNIVNNELIWSDELYALFGLDPAVTPASFDAWRGVINPDDLALAEKKIDDAVRDNMTLTSEYKITLPDGETRWIHVMGNTAYDKDNTPVRMSGICIDVSKRKHVEERLQENERLLRESQRVGHIGSYSADLITQTWMASPEIYEIFGIDETYPHTLEGWVGVISPESRAQLTGYLLQKVAEKKTFDHEYKFIRIKDGEERWAHGLGELEYDDQMNPVRLIGTIQDITKRKEAELALNKLNEELEARVKERTAELLQLNTALRQTEERYRLLSENITDGIFICKNERFEYVNEAMNSIFGYDGSELKGLRLTELALLDYREKLRTFLTLDTQLNQIRNIEAECQKKDLSNVFIEFEFHYVAKEGLVYGVAHNHTDKKQIQQNIVKTILQTEEKERAYFSKELHDGLGPLLSLIKLYIQWTQRPKGNLSQEEIVHKALDVIDEALATVKEISNKLSPHVLSYYGLTAVIQSFIDKLAETSGIRIDFQSNVTRRLKIEIEIALYRGITECINNTLKHANANNITILLKDSGSQLHLQYKDDGTGFDLHEILSQENGLGLFNLQNRIQTIGGKITMFSKPGQGVDYQITVNL